MSRAWVQNVSNLVCLLIGLLVGLGWVWVWLWLGFVCLELELPSLRYNATSNIHTSVRSGPLQAKTGEIPSEGGLVSDISGSRAQELPRGEKRMSAESKSRENQS